MPSTPPGGPKTFAIGTDADADCDHDAVTELASDAAANRFFQCEACGGVLVREAPMQSDGTDHDLGAFDPHIEDLLQDLDHYHDDRSPSVLSRAKHTVRRFLP